MTGNHAANVRLADMPFFGRKTAMSAKWAGPTLASRALGLANVEEIGQKLDAELARMWDDCRCGAG